MQLQTDEGANSEHLIFHTLEFFNGFSEIVIRALNIPEFVLAAHFRTL
jgi:hypothetical protein